MRDYRACMMCARFFMDIQKCLLWDGALFVGLIFVISENLRNFTPVKQALRGPDVVAGLRKRFVCKG